MGSDYSAIYFFPSILAAAIYFCKNDQVGIKRGSEVEGRNL